MERALTTFRNVVERLLLVWLVLLGLVAYFWPAWFPRLVAADPFAASRNWLDLLIAATMFAIGSLLPRDEVREVFRRWPMVLAGTALQYTAMPLLAFACGRLFGLEGPWLIGLIVAGCVPGAMASNVLTLLARGNVSYSVSLTTSSTLLSPLVVPLALWLTLGRFTSFPVVETAVKLLWTVVCPVLAGYTLARLWPAWEAGARRIAPLVANLTILWIIAVVVGINREKFLEIDSRLFVALLALNLGGFLAGYLGSLALRIDPAKRRALTLEIGMQNAGLGTMLVLGMFPDQPAAAIPCALFTFGCMFTGTLLARVWAMFPPKEPGVS